MGSRAPLIAAVAALALVGCGDDSTGSGGGSDMAFPGAHDMGTGGCAVVRVDAVDPVTLKPKTTAPARLLATASVSGALNASWTVERGSTGEIIKIANATGLSAQYDAAEADTWTFQVTFGNGHCGGRGGVTLATETGRMVPYILRAAPRESSMFTMTDTPITLVGGSPQTRDIRLDSGTPVSGVVQGPSGGVKAEVRFIGQLAPDAVTVTGADGSFRLAVLGGSQYTPLLVPSTTTLAPHLGPTTSGVALTGASFNVGAGATVTGSIADSAAAPVAGARVTMRAGLLPSGAGLSDASGAFTLHAEPATYTLSFGAPDWPEGALAGVAVPAAGASMTVAYTVTRYAVGATIVASDGTTPVPGARVTITSRPLGDVADVGLGGATLHAQGRVARVEIADANGKLPAMHLPLGTYDIVIEPPGPSMDGLTAVTKVLGGTATWTLALERPVLLQGIVRDPAGNPVSSALVTALETVGLGAAPTTFTDGTGHYQVSVGSGAPVLLEVDPVADAKLAGVRLSLPARTTSADVALGPGLQVTGQVQAPAGAAPVPGVRVDALCVGCGSTAPIATSISDGQGVYKLYLPDPGLILVDGGAGD